ncbi:MAG: hypothetical protein ACQ9ET_00065 [Nitrosomonadaceae bacterium]
MEESEKKKKRVKNGVPKSSARKMLIYKKQLEAKDTQLKEAKEANDRLLDCNKDLAKSIGNHKGRIEALEETLKQVNSIIWSDIKILKYSPIHDKIHTLLNH